MLKIQISNIQRQFQTKLAKSFGSLKLNHLAFTSKICSEYNEPKQNSFNNRLYSNNSLNLSNRRFFSTREKELHTQLSEDYDIKNCRNVAIIAHVDHGKTT